MPVTATIGAVTAVTSLVSAVNNVSDSKKRRLYEQNLASLSYSQKEALGRVLMKQTSEEAKLKVLADNLGRLNEARISAISKVELEKQKTRKYLYVTLAIGVLVIGGVLLFIRASRNKR